MNATATYSEKRKICKKHTLNITENLSYSLFLPVLSIFIVSNEYIYICMSNITRPIVARVTSCSSERKRFVKIHNFVSTLSNTCQISSTSSSYLANELVISEYTFTCTCTCTYRSLTMSWRGVFTETLCESSWSHNGHNVFQSKLKRILLLTARFRAWLKVTTFSKPHALFFHYFLGSLPIVRSRQRSRGIHSGLLPFLWTAI